MNETSSVKQIVRQGPGYHCSECFGKNWGCPGCSKITADQDNMRAALIAWINTQTEAMLKQLTLYRKLLRYLDTSYSFETLVNSPELINMQIETLKKSISMLEELSKLSNPRVITP
jgi:hypothetical protein